MKRMAAFVSKNGVRAGRFLIWVATVTVCTFLLVSTWIDHDGVADFGNLFLNLALLLITATTLHLALPNQARLWLDRQSELGLDDLLFFVVGDNEDGIPRDILLQLHVAMTNVGGRKCVVSRIELIGLLDSAGQIVDLGFHGVRGMEYSTRNIWLDTHAVLQGQASDLQHYTLRSELPAPFVLSPDDVITVRLRARSGIDWSEKWSLAKLDEYARNLERPIHGAQVAVAYRRGNELVTENFEVPIAEKQQTLYLAALRYRTQYLTVRPEIPLQKFPNS